MPALTLNTAEPLICDYYTTTNIVTTTEELADPMSAKDAEHYAKAGKHFAFVGPLLDGADAKRAVGTLHNQPAAQTSGLAPGQASGREQDVQDHAYPMSLVNAAASSSQRVVYVSMGTVITGDDEQYGWNATSGTSLTGQQLCQAVYRAVFEEFGVWSDPEESNADFAPALIVVSLGPQPTALANVALPSNAVCVRSVPQVDLLRTQPVLFVTNGGQNSLMESLTVGTPVVVCPGFGDQVANAAKVQVQGWGVKVDRPKAAADVGPSDVAVESTVTSYQAAVQSAVREVVGSGQYSAKARLIAAGLAKAEGVPGALRVVLQAAAKPARMS